MAWLATPGPTTRVDGPQAPRKARPVYATPALEKAFAELSVSQRLGNSQPFGGDHFGRGAKRCPPSTFAGSPGVARAPKRQIIRSPARFSTPAGLATRWECSSDVGSDSSTATTLSEEERLLRSAPNSGMATAGTAAHAVRRRLFEDA
eukprot:TRINITY_DN2595_c0_g1_i1.p1 TRINITY_DN2595_c0_g1~~TRINITY_DN2595_c0_g1_i1.p1  ORF type:complete len:155 (+),score=7.38 TRINITY_DN2595_c0_g1_i1:23-466(+)